MNTSNSATAETLGADDARELSGWQKGFWSLIVTQFQGAFSDNALKQLVMFLILGMNLSEKSASGLVSAVGALFALPFILFSMTGGFFADRFSKRTVTMGVKCLEIGIMTLALFGLATMNLQVQLGCVFLMGVHSAIFGPSKYGLLPELVPNKKLSWGNGVLELGTFLAIILGTQAGGFLSEHFAGRQQISGLALIGLATFGLLTSFGIAKVPAANPSKKFNRNPLGDLASQLRIARQDRPLWLAVIGNVYFSFFAWLVMQNIVLYGKNLLHLSDTQNSNLNTALAIGIGLGSLAAGYLSGEKIEYGLIPLGAIGMTVISLALGIPDIGYWPLGIGLALLGFFSGFFIVPIAALLQRRPDPANKGAILAAANLTSFIGVFAGSAVYYLFSSVWSLSPVQVFLLGGMMTLFGTIYCLKLLPDAFGRLLLTLLTHSVYRIKVTGRQNVPVRGGALLVCNHLSFVDALLVIASSERPIRFLMFQGIYDLPYVKPLARMLGVIPISSGQRPRAMIKSLRTASEAVKNGELVCIFAEGQITRVGHLLPFRRGFERIMQGVEAPIIPVCLDGVWGSIFSFADGKFTWKWPRKIPYPLTVSFGAAMPPTSTPAEVRRAVQELQTDAWALRKPRMLTIHRAFIDTARRHSNRAAFADSAGEFINFGEALAKTIFIAQRLKKYWDGQKMVGILLPPSIGAAATNFAALLCGKVPVHLNYTLSPEGIESCIHQCGITTVVSSKAFLDKVKIAVPCPVVYLEDAAANPTAGEKARAGYLAKIASPSAIERELGGGNTSLDDLATVVFSSGSTGEPKGVMLSHYNVQSNVAQLGQTVALRPTDRFLGILPFFHSFGFTATLTLPATLGAAVVFHPNPLDARAIGPLVAKHGITFLLATPTFLQFYLRACQAEDFGSLRFVLASGEKLPERLATNFDEKFGVRPVEAYGCTECSPALTVNTHDFRAAGFRQIGAKRGKIGHPLPGVSVRIVDPDTLQPLDASQSGLLLVRGPNVFQGYLGKPEKTAQAFRDGWYATGDIASVDEDGFLQITDRLSRFSKIGGEMVPHVKIEEKLHEICGIVEQTFAVTGVPDDKKGERLVVVHTYKADLADCLESLNSCGLPNLWIPKANQFFKVDALPVLGTGKINLRKIREIAGAVNA